MTRLLLCLLLLAGSVQAATLRFYGERDPRVFDKYPEAHIGQGGFRLSFWQGQYTFSVDLTRNLADELAGSWENEGQGEIHRMYAKDSTTFEWEIVFREKPTTNVFQYRLYTNVIPVYQEPDAVPADSVKGSYALFVDSKNDRRVIDPVTGDTTMHLYGWGKAGHIYRPKTIDALGREEWCDLSIDGETITLTVDWAVLDSAAYPLILDPTFGTTSNPASTGQTVSDYQQMVAWVTPGCVDHKGALTAGKVYGNWDGTYKVGIYTYNDVVASMAYEGSSDSTGKHNNAYEWVSCNWSGTDTLLENTAYSLGIKGDLTGGALSIGYDDYGASGNCGLTLTDTDLDWAATMTGASTTNRAYAVYVEYTVVANVDSVIYFRGATYVEDTYLNYAANTTNYGGADSLRIYYSSLTPFSNNALVKVARLRDSLDASLNIVACTLITPVKAAPTGAATIALAAMSKPIIEAQATYNSWDAANSKEWGTAGCGNENATACADDFNVTDAGGYDRNVPATSVSAATTSKIVRWAVDTCHANDWLQARDTGDGVCLRMTTNLRATTFGSVENTQTLLRPYWKFHVTEPVASTGPVKDRHSPYGTGVRQSPEGGSTR